MFDTKDLDITIDETNITTGVADIVAELRPEWNMENVEIKNLSGGYINLVLKVHDITRGEDDAISIKIMPKGAKRIADHSFLKPFLKWLNGKVDGLVDLLCCFSNGYVFKYYKGDRPNSEDMKTGHVVRKLFMKLHQLHQVPVSDEILAKNKDSNIYFINTACKDLASENAKKMLNGEKRLSDYGLNWDEVMKIADKTKKLYTKFVSEHELVVCHMDSRTDNLILDESTGDVNIIDWELACVSSEIIDLSAIFIRDPEGKLEETGILPAMNKETLDSWLLLYLQTHPKYNKMANELFPEWKKKLIFVMDVMYQYAVVVMLGIAVTTDYEVFLKVSLKHVDKWRLFQKNYNL